jgi:tetratricopeptide (TPR) repeat protein
VAAACGTLWLGGCSSDQERLARHLESYREFSKAGKNKEALIELRSALQIDPKNADVNFQIAELMAKENRLADAVFFYREASRLDPARHDAGLAEAKLVMFEDPTRARELIDEALEREPTNVVAHLRRSELALANNDADGALEAALTAVEIAPGDAMAQMQLGIVNLARLRAFRLRGEEPPEDVFRQAEAALRKADEMFGGGPNVRVELGRLYAIWPGHGDQAEAMFRSAFEAADTDEMRGRVAGSTASFARVERDEELLRWSLEAMVKHVPTNLPAWDELALVEERREAGKGDDVYRRLLALRPDDADAHVRFARFMVRGNRVQEAIDHLEEQARTGSQPALTLEALTGVRLARGEVDAARAVVERMEQEQPGHPRTKLAQARLALVEGRDAEAVELLRAYVGSEDTVEGQRMLAIAEMRTRNFPAAVAAADAAIQREIDSPVDLLRLRAQIHQAAGDWPQVLLTIQRMARQGARAPADQLLYARALYQTGRPQLGRAVLDQMLAAESPPVEALLEYARREGETNPEKAEEYLDRVLAQAPRNADALQLRASRAMAAGKPDEALAALDRAAEAGPLGPAMVLTRAQILTSKGDLVRAEEEARRAFAAAPNLTPALDLLARIYTAQNRVDEAIASFEEAEKVGALPPSGQVLLGRLHLAAGH